MHGQNHIKSLLHLVGILFPHINDDARSKSHQSKNIVDAVIQNFKWKDLNIELQTFEAGSEKSAKHLQCRQQELLSCPQYLICQSVLEFWIQFSNELKQNIIIDLEMRFAISHLHMNDWATEIFHRLIYVLYLPVSGRLSKLGVRLRFLWPVPKSYGAQQKGNNILTCKHK